jgi:opacity protein-like surface antigen
MKLPGNLSLRETGKYINTGVAALGVLAFAAQADAADIYAPGPAPVPFPVAAPVALWSGFYGGAHVGGAWTDFNTRDLDSYWFFTPSNTTALPYIPGVLRTDQSRSGVFGGGTIGYNAQRGGVVFGIEADFGDMDLNGNKLLSNPYKTSFTETARAHISTGFYGDVTGRVGWAWGPWLLYGKGGLAVLEATTNVSDRNTDFVGFGSADSTHVGWTAGGGVEYLWNPAWSVKVEYQFFDFGTSSSTLFTTSPVDGTVFSIGRFDHDLDINTVKVGINYHLGCCDTGVLPPLK